MLSMLKSRCLWLKASSTVTLQCQPGDPLVCNSFIFFCWCAFPLKKIIVLQIKCLNCCKVNVIPAPVKATHRDQELCLGALKPADKTAPGEGFLKKIRERKRKGRESWGKMDRQLPQPTGRHLWLLQATHTGTVAGTGRLLIYLGLLSLRGRGLLEINAIFSPWCVVQLCTT